MTSRSDGAFVPMSLDDSDLATATEAGVDSCAAQLRELRTELTIVKAHADEVCKQREEASVLQATVLEQQKMIDELREQLSQARESAAPGWTRGAASQPGKPAISANKPRLSPRRSAAPKIAPRKQPEALAKRGQAMSPRQSRDVQHNRGNSRRGLTQQHEPELFALYDFLQIIGASPEKLFSQLDVNQGGVVSQADFVSRMSYLRYPGDVEALWDAIDVYQDGAVNLEEFVEMVPRVAVKGQSKGKTVQPSSQRSPRSPRPDHTLASVRSRNSLTKSAQSFEPAITPPRSASVSRSITPEPRMGRHCILVPMNRFYPPQLASTSHWTEQTTKTSQPESVYICSAVELAANAFQERHHEPLGNTPQLTGKRWSARQELARKAAARRLERDELRPHTDLLSRRDHIIVGPTSRPVKTSRQAAALAAAAAVTASRTPPAGAGRMLASGQTPSAALTDYVSDGRQGPASRTASAMVNETQNPVQASMSSWESSHATSHLSPHSEMLAEDVTASHALDVCEELVTVNENTEIVQPSFADMVFNNDQVGTDQIRQVDGECNGGSLVMAGGENRNGLAREDLTAPPNVHVCEDSSNGCNKPLAEAEPAGESTIDGVGNWDAIGATQLVPHGDRVVQLDCSPDFETVGDIKDSPRPHRQLSPLASDQSSVSNEPVTRVSSVVTLQTNHQDPFGGISHASCPSSPTSELRLQNAHPRIVARERSASPSGDQVQYGSGMKRTPSVPLTPPLLQNSTSSRMPTFRVQSHHSKSGDLEPIAREPIAQMHPARPNSRSNSLPSPPRECSGAQANFEAYPADQVIIATVVPWELADASSTYVSRDVASITPSSSKAVQPVAYNAVMQNTGPLLAASRSPSAQPALASRSPSPPAPTLSPDLHFGGLHTTYSPSTARMPAIQYQQVKPISTQAMGPSAVPKLGALALPAAEVPASPGAMIAVSGPPRCGRTTFSALAQPSASAYAHQKESNFTAVVPQVPLRWRSGPWPPPPVPASTPPNREAPQTAVPLAVASSAVSTYGAVHPSSRAAATKASAAPLGVGAHSHGGPASSLKAGSITDDIFDMVDRNHDGIIDRAEFRTALKGNLISPQASRQPSRADVWNANT